MKKQQPARVVNVNKDGEIFDPASYVVRRADNPALYEFLEVLKNGSHTNR